MAERRKTADELRKDYVLHISMPEGTEPPPDSWSGEALHAVAALEAEVERLRALVETAHFEGYRQSVQPISHREAWRRSQTRRDLEGDAYTWELEGDA